MAGLWQRTGNVTVTNGSKTITGFGTKWKTGTLPIQKGHTFYGPDNAAYEVDTVVSDESILLVDTYRGGTLANQAYRIDITRTSTISQFAADLASLVAKYRSWFDGMMTWLTGSGDVAILNPDTGANVTIPSWKKVASEGEGQAARAKTEADKAAASAALAGDIVAVSALPLPDVWAPLSDSLRLITGYGRDVLVGSDVVARIVNFSRNSTATYIGKDGQLNTAAANEPRFEKEGLLIEGQSQNLVTHSVDLIAPSWNKQQSGTGSAPVVTANYAQAPDGSMAACRLQMNKGAGASAVDYSGVLHPISGLVVGATHTLSVWLKSANQNSYNISLSLNGLGSTIVAITPEWRRFTITVVLDDPTRYPRLQLRGGQGTSDTADILTWGWQQEALPFATSYIPTNGAAATRAADVCWIQNALNVGPDAPVGDTAINFALAFESDFKRTTGITAPSICGIAPSANLLASQRRASLESNGTLSLWCGAKTTYGIPGRGVAVICKRGAESICSYNGSIKKAPFINGYAGSHLALETGHVRNIRIWLNALTDEQIKAIK
ncbi:phage head spike fiber domain-containing protein [Aeromonas caviae]|uniref:phage head spike fiber domain-containing protein n=1 Tax=Aeromonas caviae TaxID=648 RepID=UPI0008528461|nr:hypothetical protein [Aeromonas caviae]OEG07706.1 hypothetical protein BFG06_12725 [Aeromonas caviae]